MGKMALNINGCNATSKTFVDFAQQRVNANDAKAVAGGYFNRLDGASKAFGEVTFTQCLVSDLEAEIPTVTDFQISQSID